MKRRLTWAAATAIAAALAYALVFGFGGSPAARSLAGSTVKVIVGDGHGSGVHIGNGYIVTAAHVVRDKDQVKIKADDGGTVTAPVLWRNRNYDIALVRLAPKAAARLDVADLSCRVPAVGESVEAFGNPNDVEFLRNIGHVSGRMRQAGPWAEVVVLDMTIAPGMSGGPVLDQHGRVVAISVGVSISSIGFMPSMVPIAFAVPGRTVCHLLAR